MNTHSPPHNPDSSFLLTEYSYTSQYLELQSMQTMIINVFKN